MSELIAGAWRWLAGEVVLQTLLEATAIVVAAWFGVRFISRMANRAHVRAGEEQARVTGAHAGRTYTVIHLLYSVGRAVILVSAALLVLNLFFPIGPLLAGVGVLGLAVSFGSQSLVKDWLSGFFLLSEDQFRVGDVIEVDGTSGVVERMTLRIVVLRDVHGVTHAIPNGSIAKVSNKTRVWARVVLDVPVAYKESVDRVVAVLQDVGAGLAEDRSWSGKLSSPPSVWGVQDFAESAVTIRMAVDVRAGKQWEVRRELLRRIKNRFDAEGIEIPFPQRTVHLPGGWPGAGGPG